MNNKSLSLFLIYGLAIVALIPIIQYAFSIGMYDPNRHGKPSYFLVSIFSCGPVLLILGVILLRSFKGLKHKLSGGLSIVIGIIWLVQLFMGLAAEQG